jgi:hypothetical protein
VLYAHLSDPQTQSEMLRLAGVEGKQGGLANRIKGGEQKHVSWWDRKEPSIVGKVGKRLGRI